MEYLAAIGCFTIIGLTLGFTLGYEMGKNLIIKRVKKATGAIQFGVDEVKKI